MKKLAILAAAALISTSASAVNWVLADYNTEFYVYVDTDSISRSGKHKSAFLMRRYNRPFHVMDGKYVDSYTSYELFDCNGNPRKVKTVSAIFRLNKQVMFNSDEFGSLGWSILHPGSVGYSAANIVCSR